REPCAVELDREPPLRDADVRDQAGEPGGGDLLRDLVERRVLRAAPGGEREADRRVREPATEEVSWGRSPGRSVGIDSDHEPGVPATGVPLPARRDLTTSA